MREREIQAAGLVTRDLSHDLFHDLFHLFHGLGTSITALPFPRPALVSPRSPLPANRSPLTAIPHFSSWANPLQPILIDQLGTLLRSTWPIRQPTIAPR